MDKLMALLGYSWHLIKVGSTGEDGANLAQNG